tara:strand:- start:10261 stop:12054 length:1794 start_codon:yes stop_codon:yes gene_type:complete
MLRNLYEFFSLMEGQQKLRLFKIQFMIIFSSFLETISVLSIGPFMTLVSSPETINSNFYISKAYQFFNIQEPNNFLILFGTLILILMIISAFFSMITIWRLSILGGQIGADLSNRMFTYYVKRPLSFHLQTNSSQLASKLIVESNRLTHSVLLQFLYLNSKLILILMMIVTILITVPIIAIISTLLFLVSYISIYRFASYRLNRNGIAISNESQSRMRTINESFGGIKDLLLHGLQTNFISKYKKSTDNYYSSWSSNQVLALLPRYAIELTAYGTMISAILFLLFSFDNNIGKVLPVIAVFGLASMKMLPAFQQCYFSVSTMRANINAYLVVRKELLDIRNRDDSDDGDFELKSELTFKEKVSLHGISFKYQENKDDVLNEISLDIKANQTVGLVGASGSGKSTAINILIGLLQPTKGSISVDGQELTKETIGAWQQKIGFVSQDIFLLDASIKENIAFGYHPKDIDLDRIDKVLEMAQLDKFVLTLPNGVDTGVGERGMQLSGGQSQRIGIARALYGNPEILVFDEATSNLDRISEKLIMETITAIGKSTTIIMIAHRLSTVKECDNIFLFSNGSIEDSGSYDYLQKTNSQFADLT